VANYNPYAAPAAPPVIVEGVPPVGEPQPWSIEEALRGAWDAYKTSWAPLSLGYFVITLLGGFPGQIPPLLAKLGVLDQHARSYLGLNVGLTIVGWIATQFFTAGFTRVALHSARARSPRFGEFFGGGGNFFVFLVASLLRAVVVGLGFLLLIAPGIILSLGLTNTEFYVIDQKLGPVEAMKASWRSTEGQKGQLFVLGLAEFGIVLLGLLAACFGIIVAVPVMFIARAIVYTRMSGTMAAVAAPPSPYGGFGPPGGSGPRGYGGPPGYGGGPPGYGYPPPGGFGGRNQS
jgi:hypothetical protein